MKRILILAVCFLALPAARNYAECGAQPAPPTPPPGCEHLHAQCVCDDNGNCDWQFVCDRCFPGADCGAEETYGKETQWTLGPARISLLAPEMAPLQLKSQTVNR